MIWPPTTANRYADPMIAANIWHWWIGIVLAAAGILAVIGVVAGYLKSVTSQRIRPEDSPSPTAVGEGER